MHNFNIFTFSSLVAFLGCSILACYVFLKGRHRLLNRAFAVQTFLMGTWCLFPTAVALPAPFSFFLVQVSYAAAIFNVPAFTRFCFVLLGVQSFSQEKKILKGLAWIAVLLVALLPTRLFLNEYVSPIPYVLRGSPVFFIFVVLFVVTCLYNFYRLIVVYLSTRGLKRNQYKYFIIAFNIAFIGAVIHLYYIITCKNEVVPHDFLLIIYASICTYAIIKYRLMDVTVVITRTTIFIVVYSFVLGIPFAIAFGWKERLQYAIGENWWLFPLISSTVLATAGPFIYLFIQKKAEDRCSRNKNAISPHYGRHLRGWVELKILPVL